MSWFQKLVTVYNKSSGRGSCCQVLPKACPSCAIGTRFVHFVDDHSAAISRWVTCWDPKCGDQMFIMKE